jgi:cobalt/nickel transport system permease protein
MFQISAIAQKGRWRLLLMACGGEKPGAQDLGRLHNRLDRKSEGLNRKNVQMHLPDGFLDTRAALLSSGVAVAGIGVAVRQVKISLEPRQVPMLGLAAAFVFAAQMLNFPVVGGTSGHLVGGVLTAVLLGPAAAIIVISCVLIVQCLMFSDGGLLALGANIFNMAIVSVCGGYFVFKVVKKVIRMEEQRATVFASAFAAWFGTVLASIACAGEIALSGTAPWELVFPAMTNVHMLIGVGEGLATGLIVLTVLKRRPGLVVGVRNSLPAERPGFLLLGMLVCVGLVMFVAPFACPWPDGLETVARLLGFEHRTEAGSTLAPLAGYHLPAIGSATAGTAIAGAAGTICAFIAAYLLARALVPVLGPAKKNAPGAQ